MFMSLPEALARKASQQHAAYQQEEVCGARCGTVCMRQQRM